MRTAWAALFTLLAAACVTVDLDPSEVEIALTPGQSALHEASRQFCRQSRDRHWADGEKGLAGVPAALGAGESAPGLYSRHILAAAGSETERIRLVRGDIAALGADLQALTDMADKVVAEGKATKADIAEFERVVIHAAQAHDTFSRTLSDVVRVGPRPVEPVRELAAFSRAVQSARGAADRLAASIVSSPLS